MGSMSNKRIILAHGLNGEMGVPTEVNPSGLPWNRLPEDMNYLKRTARVLILGRESYEIAERWLNEDDRLLICVSSNADGRNNRYPSLNRAFEAAERLRPGQPAYVGGGAILAQQAFELLAANGEGEFHETVVEDYFPNATTYMPAYQQRRWTKPEVLEQYPERYVEKVTKNGLTVHERIPPFHIQVRRVVS